MKRLNLSEILFRISKLEENKKLLSKLQSFLNNHAVMAILAESDLAGLSESGWRQGCPVNFIRKISLYELHKKKLHKVTS